MNARTQAQCWLAGGDAPDLLIPRMARDLLDADDGRLPLMLRAMTYMVEAMMSRTAAAALAEAMAERRFLPEDGPAHAALRAEVAAMADAAAAEAGRLGERRTLLRRTEEEVAALAAEVERLRAVLAALPVDGGAA